MLEKQLEKYLFDKVRYMGGLCEKFTSPGRRSVPDRLITVKGYMCFAEIKAPGKKPTILQFLDHQKRKDYGFDVYIIDSKESVDNFIKVLISIHKKS